MVKWYTYINIYIKEVIRMTMTDKEKENKDDKTRIELRNDDN